MSHGCHFIHSHCMLTAQTKITPLHKHLKDRYCFVVAPAYRSIDTTHYRYWHCHITQCQGLMSRAILKHLHLRHHNHNSCLTRLVTIQRYIATSKSGYNWVQKITCIWHKSICLENDTRVIMKGFKLLDRW